MTSKKEVARLLGDHRPPGALDLLVAVVADDRVHRDLRIAIGRSLRGFLDDDRPWRVLATLAARSEDEARSLLETAPMQIAPRHRPKFAELILETCQSPNQRVRAEALASLSGWGRWTDRAPLVACAVVDDLDTGPEWRAALAALSTMLQDGAGWAEATDLVRDLAGRDDGAALNTGADRDRPSAQRLHAVVDAAAELPRHAWAEHRARLRRIADLLADRPEFAPDEFMVRLAAVDWAEPKDALSALAVRLDDRPLLAEGTMGAVAHALGRDQAAWKTFTLEDAADHLVDVGSTGSGALAVQLVRSAGVRFDWSEPWRARLRALRSHSVDDVAILARRTWTATE